MVKLALLLLLTLTLHTTNMPTPEVATAEASYLPAVIGLVGVVVGGLITQGSDAIRRHRASTRDKLYLAIIVSAELEKFVDGCWEVSCDDGTYMGQPAGREGTYEAQSTNPKFDPHAIDVEWRLLDSDLLPRIWSLPGLISDANGRAHAEFEHSSWPYDNSALGVRSYEYEQLGIAAAEISMALRKSQKLPKMREGLSEIVGRMRERVQDYEKKIAEFNRRHEEWLANSQKAPD